MTLQIVSCAARCANLIHYEWQNRVQLALVMVPPAASKGTAPFGREEQNRQGPSLECFRNNDKQRWCW